MSVHICPKCGHSSQIFGNNTEALVTQLNTQILAKVPLAELRRIDKGLPIVAGSQEHPISDVFTALADKVTLELFNSAQQLLSKLI